MDNIGEKNSWETRYCKQEQLPQEATQLKTTAEEKNEIKSERRYCKQGDFQEKVSHTKTTSSAKDIEAKEGWEKRYCKQASLK